MNHFKLPALASLISLALSGMSEAQAEANPKAEEPPKSYSRAPMAAYNALMDDALLGNSYEKPVWNLHDTLGLPEWLTVGLENRTRYESVSDTFKPSYKAPAPKAGGGDQQIALQSDLWIQAKLGKFRFATEVMDSRAIASDSGANNTPNPPNNTMADTIDFTQAYVSWADKDAIAHNTGLEIKAGRQTMDLGSRRLVARPVYRNTVNNFTGLRVRALNASQWQLNVFGALPVLRFPNYGTTPINADPNLVAPNANLMVSGNPQFDREDTHSFFSGGILEGYNLIKNVNAEVYLYNLTEGDSDINATRNRKYFTPGSRIYIKPAKGKFDFVAEGMGQFGNAQYNTTVENQTQTHKAWSEHAEVGYSFDLPMSPRFLLEYDWASGSKNSSKYKAGSTDERFDPLYAATDMDFGATGIYSAFQRSNINSPGARFNFAPHKDVTISLQERIVWLASASDCWGGTACSSSTSPVMIANTKNNSGSYVGDQLGASSRYNVNSSLNFEAGYFHLFKGQFARTAVSSATGTTTPGADTNYFYVQSQLRF